MAYKRRIPFKVKDKVKMIRHRHGWFPSYVPAVIITATETPGGRWSYEARAEDGVVYELRSTKDAIKS